MPFWKREKKMCESCNQRESTRRVWMEGTKWKEMCEECFLNQYKGRFDKVHFVFA
jgi:hypothetical protein